MSEEIDPFEDRVVSNPEDADRVRALASDLGIHLQTTNLVPKGTAYIMRPPPPCWDDPEWVHGFVSSLFRVKGIDE